MAAVPTPAAPVRKGHAIVLPPTMLECGLEVSVHVPPRTMQREIAAVLPGVDAAAVLVVPTCQRSRLDLVNIGADVAAEKDALLERVRGAGGGGGEGEE
jgi:hypothetical protein